MINLELSDVFFNWPKPTYDALDSSATPEALSSAILDEAVSFCAAYPHLTMGVSPEAIADDYWRRA